MLQENPDKTMPKNSETDGKIKKAKFKTKKKM